MPIELYGHLHRQTRDDENEVTMVLKIPAKLFQLAVTVPTRKLLKVDISVIENGESIIESFQDDQE